MVIKQNTNSSPSAGSDFTEFGMQIGLFGGSRCRTQDELAPEFYEETEGFQGISTVGSYEMVDSDENRFNTQFPSEMISGSSMQKTTPSAVHNRLYRERLRAAGGEEVLFKLPREIVALLDELKERHGLRNRSQALMQLIEHGRATAQQMT